VFNIGVNDETVIYRCIITHVNIALTNRIAKALARQVDPGDGNSVRGRHTYEYLVTPIAEIYVALANLVNLKKLSAKLVPPP